MFTSKLISSVQKMKMCILLISLTILVIGECGHMFVGTSINKTMVYHHDVQYSSKLLRKRIENLYFSLPAVPSNVGRYIQGILAYDLNNSEASVNVTQGGLGFNFVNLRMKSERGTKMHYDVYIYA